MDPEKTQCQFGLWDSPISPQSMAGELDLLDVSWGQDGSLIWLEKSAGRGVLVVQPIDGQAARILTPELSIQARLGYGGGDFTVGKEEVYFVESISGRLYRQSLKYGTPRPLTPAFGQTAAPTLSPNGKWLLFLNSYESSDSLAIVDSQGRNWPQKLHTGHDFYTQPAWHPDGDSICWVAWDHPNMPWDGTSLYLGKISTDHFRLPVLTEVQIISGGNDISIFQPQFTPDGSSLVYVSDENGWWHLFLYDLERKEHRRLTSGPAEHGRPAWQYGYRTYAFNPEGDIFVLRNKYGNISLWRIDPSTGEDEQLHLADIYTYLEQISVSSHGIALLASGSGTPKRVITISYDNPESERIIRRSSPEMLPSGAYSSCKPIEWKGLDGGVVYGLFYPPQNEQFQGSGNPPLIVNIHGGPTSQVGSFFNSKAQFFASRGYAFLEVNYRGSTGYGRNYRNMLRRNWGIFDVEDAVSGVRYLSAQDLADENRAVIMGSSAGGFTVLKALQDYPGLFKAGICIYGVSNQFVMASETHKFELHYSDSLLGPLPEAAEVYYQRSPIFFADQIQDPVALFQGEDDQVVVRSQSDDMADSLERRGVPHVYHLYPGEGHGFRKPETIEHLYQSIEKFLRQYVIFA